MNMAAWEDIYRKTRQGIPVPVRNLGELHFWKDSFLRSSGWMRSRRSGMAVDAGGRPLPWYTYPAIRFLEARNLSQARVFEFGMGNSTLWWSPRADRVTTCEGDASWYDLIASTMPANVEAILVPEASDSYVRAAADRGGPYDVVIVDGRRRVECCRDSLPVLSEAGVIIWDDFHRERYHEGREFLGAAGYRELPFWGMTPITAREACTSIFYRDGNCLGI
jgi:hypothetical protein